LDIAPNSPHFALYARNFAAEFVDSLNEILEDVVLRNLILRPAKISLGL
jgi:hypothetical protein